MSKSQLDTSLSLYLIRHGETEWSLSGQHTGLTDLPLVESGKKQAELLGKRLKTVSFAKVLTSPLKRAKETVQITGLAAETDPDLVEWDYGDYEGKTTQEIYQTAPGWNLFEQGAPGGENPGDVTRRADRLLSKLESLEGTIALFSSAHFLRSLACRWVGVSIALGKSLLLSPASISILGHERNSPVIVRWNDISHLTYK